MKKNIIIVILSISFFCCKSTLDKESNLEIIQTHFSNKNFIQAVQKIDILLAEEDLDNDFILELKNIKVNCLFELKQYIRCVRLINDIIYYFPNDESLYLMRGDSYQYIDNNDLALQDYSTLIERFNNIDAYKRRGTLYIKLGWLTKANVDVDKVLELDSNHNGSLNNKGVILVEWGEYDKALEYYRKSLKVKPNKITYLNIGDFYDKINIADSACFYWKIASDSGIYLAQKYYELKCIK